MPDEAIKEAIGLGELRAAFLALKHAQDKKYFKHNLAEILNFVEISSPSELFQTYLKMLMEYSQRRSGLDDEQFNEVFEQLNPDLEMASKTIFDRAEERAFARGEAKADQKVQEADQKVQEADQKVQKADQKVQEADQKVQEIAQKAEQKLRKAVINLIQKTNMSDAQIVEIQEVDLLFVQSIRKELKG